MLSGNNVIDEITESDIDRSMLESYGIDGEFFSDGTLNESIDRKPKLFGVDGFLVFNLEDTVERIFRDETFSAVLDEFHGKAEDFDAYELVAEWSVDFLKRFVLDWTSSLTKGEMLRYDEMFRKIAGEYGNDELVSWVKSDDKRFDKMPKIVRIQ